MNINFGAKIPDFLFPHRDVFQSAAIFHYPKPINSYLCPSKIMPNIYV